MLREFEFRETEAREPEARALAASVFPKPSRLKFPEIFSMTPMVGFPNPPTGSLTNPCTLALSPLTNFLLYPRVSRFSVLEVARLATMLDLLSN